MRILVVEDDKKIAEFVQKGLKSSGFAVDHATTGSQGFEMGFDEPYDAMIVDIMLPKMDGISLIKKLREQKNNTPVIILSARDRVDDRVNGLQAGADDYLTKPFAFSELLARIQALIRRAGNIADPVNLSYADLSIDILKRQVKRDNKPIEVQPLEFSLLEYLLRNKERVVSKTMIMEHVWNYNFDPMTNVVEARICRLRDKIDKNFEPKLIHTVRGAGYVLKV
ncbi:response regulator [Desulfobacula phenolica]|uniref:DNA-binding response regulator, OmpR family, contains REC and winged-helix (WHTH) domain n=1 Tax=Desulfobacula phenolica TaxID=90732 RepID=A0A1H2HV08_9BACT|nr:response regulator transcription factor [Desulfobacula phenolica]SDU35720.1 DNA-binding response regulator, OmpR family, contains REC and winged-helix (wHTH) domain [Desulfobacula phenolica]